jgi:DNA polymerase-3 subunit delta'
MELSGDEPAIEIEAIRELAQRLAIAYEGRRVVFVPGLDRLTLPAANAFLKILEEPGGSTVYVMTSGRTANLLPTILSRCHRLPLFPARAAESAPALDIDALLAQPDALERMDLADLLEPFGGRDKRERFEALLAYSAGRIEARIAELLDGASAGAPGAWLAGLPLDDVLCLAEEILELADDATWNVNTDLMLEAFAAAIRRAGRVA